MRRTVYFLIVLVMLACLAGFLGKTIWWADLLSNFAVYYGLVFLVSTLLFLLWKKYLAALLSAVFFVFAGWNILLLYIPDQEIAAREDLKIISANILSSNPRSADLLEYIREQDPDIILLLEVTSGVRPLMNSLVTEYPFYLQEVREDNFGIAVFCKRKPDAMKIHYFGDPAFPSVIVRYNSSFTFIGTHPMPPISAYAFSLRNHQLGELAGLIAELPGNVILAGDLNSTPFSRIFRDFLEDTGMRHAGRGFGINPTWHAGIPMLDLPLDHVLTRGSVHTHSYGTGPYFGSDHLPLSVSLSFEPENIDR